MCAIYTNTCKIRNAFELHNFIYSSLQRVKQAMIKVLKEEKDKTSDDNSIAVKFSNTSEIWSLMILFNREIAMILVLGSANSETQLNSKPVWKTPIIPLPKGKLFIACVW